MAVREWLERCDVHAVETFEGGALVVAVVLPAGVEPARMSVAGMVATGLSAVRFGPANTVVLTVEDGPWRGARACVAIELVDSERRGVYTVVDVATTN